MLFTYTVYYRTKTSSTSLRDLARPWCDLVLYSGDLATCNPYVTRALGGALRQVWLIRPLRELWRSTTVELKDARLSEYVLPN